MDGLYRDQALLLNALFLAGKPVSGLVLCEKVRYGVKTLKKEINYINSICTKNGCFIDSITGVGYYMVVTDEGKYTSFRERVENLYRWNQYYGNAQSERIHYIIRQLLSLHQVFIQELADLCHCSESTINRDMRGVKDRLRNYGLNISNHTNQGIYLIGSEWNIRLALINECYIYDNFDRVEFFESEKSFDAMIFASGTFARMVREKLDQILMADQDYLQYQMTLKMSRMVILTMTRRRYADGLEDFRDQFDRLNTEREEAIVSEVFSQLPSLSKVALSDIERKALAIYLKANRIYKMNEFINECPDREEIITIVDGFLDYLSQRIDLSRMDTSVIRKDLCCELSRLKYCCMFNIHLNDSDVNNYRQDGLFNLDQCSLLYQYLRDHTEIECTTTDIIQFYYIFAFLSSKRSDSYKNRILVVSKDGFYCSRSIARQMANMSNLKNLELVPLEYLRIREVDLSEYDCIATDIGELKDKYPDKLVLDIGYFRREEQIRNFLNRIIMPHRKFRESILKKDDMISLEGEWNMASFYRYIEDEILEDGDDKQLYMSVLKRKNEIFAPTRKNNIAIFNTPYDVLGRSFMKIIHIHYGLTVGNSGSNSTKIILYNVGSKDINEWLSYSEMVAKLLHDDEFILSGNRDDDYQLVEKIIYQ